MKQARITERKPKRSGRLFWYLLEALDAPDEKTKPLACATARAPWRNPFLVDPDEQRKAYASLNAWAERNGWIIVE